MNRRLIITADDYGLCDSVNQAIDACIEAGTVQATCVMTNMPVYARAAQLRERFPGASVGAHWTLTAGQPVLAASQVPSLVDTDGRFYPREQLRRRWLAGQINESEIAAELRAQTARLRTIIGLPDFWNTHQDIHMVPGLFQTCVALGLELGIPAMRSHRRIMVFRHTTQMRHNLLHPLFWAKGFVIDRWSQRAEAKGMRMPDGKVYIHGYDLSLADVAEAVGRLPWDSVSRAAELIVHPAVTIEEDVMNKLRESRIREYEVFADPRLAEGIRKLGVQLISFGGLECDQ